MTVRSQKSEDGRESPRNRRTGKAFPLNDMYVLNRNLRKDRDTPEVRRLGKAFSGRHNRGDLFNVIQL